MSPNFEGLFHEVSRDYTAMWDFKFRGATLEIITPHSTISDKFVSVFLTERDNTFIITDGGYLHTGDYVENESIRAGRCYNNAFGHYERYYSIRRVSDRNGKVIFFLKTENRQMVTALIHDMASFIVGVANAQQMTLETDQEVVTRQRFAKAAGSFLLDSFPGRQIKFNQELRPDDRIHFSAGIWKGQQVNLIQFITGYDAYHFDASMAKATMNFLAVDSSSLQPSVQSKISLIDTTAGGYGTRGNSSYSTLLSSASSMLSWDERRDLVDLVESQA
jgi:hypothetical protein